MLGKSERVKAPTALPTAMESACTGPGDLRGSATRSITIWRYCRAIHHEALTEEAVPLCSGLPVGVRPQASPAKPHLKLAELAVNVEVRRHISLYT